MSAGARRAVAVVGGGLSGLAAARRLAARGDVDVTVWEASARAGGVVETTRAGGFTLEHAANGFLLGAAGGGAELAEELGLALEPAAASARRRWIYRRGALRALGGPADLLRGELVPLRGLLRALAEPLAPVRRGGGDESIADFVRRRLGAEVLDGLVAPMVTGVFAGDPEELSLAAAFPKLAELEAEGGLAVASAARALRRAWAGLSSDGPRARTPRGIASPVGGMGALTGALAAGLGPRVRTGAGVVAIEVAAGGRERAVRLAGGESHAVDAVVLAVPAPAAARLVSDASGDLARVLDEIRFAPIAVVHLGYPRAALASIDGFGFLVAKGEELRILGAVFESSIWPARAPEGQALVRCMLGGVRDPGVLALADDELVAQARRDLSRAGVVGMADEPVMTNVVRWPRAIAQYTLGHRERVARAEGLAEPLGVVLAGSSYHGVSINACAADARRVEHRVATRLGLPLAALVALATACSSGPKTTPRSAGDAVGATPAPVAATPAKAPADGSPTAAGEVDVTVEWLSPPAQHVSSPGRNECGAPRRPGLVVSSLGGVDGAVVTLEGASGSGSGSGSGSASGSGSGSELILQRCQVAPRALLVHGGPLEVVNLDERRHDVTLEWVEQGKSAAAALARFPLVLVGQRVAVDLDRTGVLRAATAIDPGAASYVVVADQPYVAVSDERGKVAFRGVPPGRYEVSVWHPPLAGGQPPVTARAAVEVGTAAGASLTVSLAPAKP